MSRWKAIVFEPSESRDKPFYRRLKGLSLVFLLCCLNAVIGQTGLYGRYEVSDLDKLARHALDAPRKAGTDVPAAVVLIDDDDYAKYFGQRSPMGAAPLLNIVQTLCQLHVARIGVDLFTADWPDVATEKLSGSRDVLDETPQHRQAILHDLGDCPVVWIRDGEPLAQTSVAGSEGFRLGGVLGENSLPSNGACTALPTFRPDPDGVVRHYSPTVPAGTSSQDLRPYVTMAYALRPSADGRPCGYAKEEDMSPSEPPLIGYNADQNIVRLPSSSFYFPGPESKRKEFYEQVSQTARKIGLGPKTVVVLGGSYRFARDEYNTPLGSLFGAEILANAAVGRKIRLYSPWYGLLLDFGVSSLVFLFINWLRFIWRALVSLAVGILLAFIFGWWFFTVNGNFLGVFSALAGAFIAVVLEPTLEKIFEDGLSIREALYPRTARTAAASVTHSTTTTETLSTSTTEVTETIRSERDRS